MSGLKRCSRCGEAKAPGSFNRNRSQKDGLQARCRACQIASNREWREDNPDLSRARSRRSDKRRRVPRPSDRQQRNVGKKLSRAVRSGKLVKPDACPKCGKSDSPIQGHHRDYSRPLDVEWLCARCHARLHARARLLVGAP